MALDSVTSSTTRLYGLSSGLDTETIVNNLMSVEQLKIDKVFRQKEKAQWTLDAYNNINSQLKTFRQTYFSALSPDTNMYSVASYRAYDVSVGTNNAISIESTSSASATSFSIKKVQQALTATAASTAGASKAIEAIGTTGEYLNANISGSALQIDPSIDVTTGTALKDLVTAEGDSIFGFSEGNESLQFSINGHAFSFTGDSTIEDVLTAINGADGLGTDTGAVMEFDDITNTFSLRSTTFGDSSTLSVSDLTGVAFSGSGGFFLDSDDIVNTGSVKPSSRTFAELANMRGITMTGSSFTINGQTFTFGTSDDTGDIEMDENATIQTVMDTVNNAGLGVSMSYVEAKGTFSIRADSSSSISSLTLSGNLFGSGSVTGIAAGTTTKQNAIKLTDTIQEAARKLGTTSALDAAKDSDGNITLTINGKDFKFATNVSLSSMMTTINSSSGLGATVNFSEIRDQFSVSSETYGQDSTITLSGFDIFGVDGTASSGRDATVELTDGTVIQQSSNNFTLDGLQFEISGDFEAATDDDGILVKVTKDIDSVVDKVKSFITAYNDLVETLNTKYTETKNYDYEPLTDDERDELTDDEAEKWDEKAKSGILRNDANLSSLLTNMRKALYTEVEGTGLSLSSLGITTTSWSAASWKTEQGKLELDEDTLRSALANNPNAVEQVFAASNNDSDGDLDFNSSGFISRISNSVNSYISNTSKTSIATLKSNITDYSDKIDDMEDNYADLEETYWDKYSAMESLMTELNSQSSWLSAQLSSLS